MVSKFDYTSEGRILSDKDHFEQVIQSQFGLESTTDESIEILAKITSEIHPNFYIGSDLSDVSTNHDTLTESINSIGSDRNRLLQKFSYRLLYLLAMTDKEPLRRIYDLYDSSSESGMQISYHEFKQEVQDEMDRDAEVALSELFSLIENKEAFFHTTRTEDGSEKYK